MDWQALLQDDIQDFIRDHVDADVTQLGLKKTPCVDWPYVLILDQIKARQKMSKKNSDWAENFDLIMPPSDIVEQASSYACAAYKASLVDGKIFTDFTAGSGSDAAAFLSSFDAGICVERDQNLAKILEHNLKILSPNKCRIFQETAENFVQHMPDVDLAYIDPQRRDNKRRGIYDLSESSPNIIDLLPILKTKTTRVMLKTSPVLDIHKTVQDLGAVSAVHIVQYHGDCKEVLYLLDFEKNCEEPVINAVNIDEHGVPKQSLSFTMSQEKKHQISYEDVQQFLYEPGPAFQKCGGYASIAVQYNLAKLHSHTHLYTINRPIDHFPGRRFEVIHQCPADKKALRKILPDMKANLTLRNFPGSTEELRKKLKLKDGGEITVFACTDFQDQKIFILCKKA